MNFRFPSLFSTSWSAFRVYIYVLTFEMWIYDQFYAKQDVLFSALIMILSLP